MESLPLDLVIALGGIATGIGAIWTAVVTRNLARATERSLDEQSQSLREQNERARINLETDLMYKLVEQWNSRTYQEYRRKSLQFVKENFLTNDDLQEVQHIDAATQQLFDYFDEIGYLTRSGILQTERVMNHGNFRVSILQAWPLWEPAVDKLREEDGRPTAYTHFEYLHRQALDFDRARGGTGAPPSKEELRHFVEASLKTEEEIHSAVWEQRDSTSQ